MSRRKQQRRRTARPWLMYGSLAAGLMLLTVVGGWYYKRTHPSKPRSPSAEARLVLQRVAQLHNEGKYDEAISMVRSYLAREPDAPEFHYVMGVLLGSQGDHRAAIAEFEREIRDNPAFAESYNSLGTAYIRLGELDRAIPPLEKCLQLNPQHPVAGLQLGRILSQQGRLGEAEQYLLSAVAHAQDRADASFELGLLYRKSGRPEQAEEAFREALADNPRHLGALLNLGQTLLRLNRQEEGEQLLQRHSELATWYDRLEQAISASSLRGATAHNFLHVARLRLEAQQYPEAISAYKRALELDAKFLPAVLGLAALLISNNWTKQPSGRCTR